MRPSTDLAIAVTDAACWLLAQFISSLVIPRPTANIHLTASAGDSWRIGCIRCNHQRGTAIFERGEAAPRHKHARSVRTRSSRSFKMRARSGTPSAITELLYIHGVEPGNALPFVCTFTHYELRHIPEEPTVMHSPHGATPDYAVTQWPKLFGDPVGLQPPVKMPVNAQRLRPASKI